MEGDGHWSENGDKCRMGGLKPPLGKTLLPKLKSLFSSPQPSGSVNGTCNGKEVRALQKLRLEEHYINRTRSPETDLEKVYEGYGVETSKSSGQLVSLVS